MEISQKTKDLCLKIALGHIDPEHVTIIKTELENIFGGVAALSYCRILVSCALLTRLPNVKDVKPEDIDTWYQAKNTLIRYLANYAKEASKECPVYLAMVKARDSVNLI